MDIYSLMRQFADSWALLVLFTVFLGVILSLMMYLHRSSRPEIFPVVPARETGAYHFEAAKGQPECPQLRIVRINGAIFFGAASYVQQALQQIDEENPRQKSVLIAAANINNIDIAGAEVLAQEAHATLQEAITLACMPMPAQVRRAQLEVRGARGSAERERETRRHGGARREQRERERRGQNG